jgi:hypothetical protein
MELVDVGGCAEPRFVPGLRADGLRQSFFKLADMRGQAGAAGVGVGQVGLQRSAADGRAACSGCG